MPVAKDGVMDFFSSSHAALLANANLVAERQIPVHHRHERGGDCGRPSILPASQRTDHRQQAASSRLGHSGLRQVGFGHGERRAGNARDKQRKKSCSDDTHFFKFES